jgi:hypothetical protein
MLILARSDVENASSVLALLESHSKETRPAKLETTQPGLLESWFFGVERFGKVCISVPFNLNEV